MKSWKKLAAILSVLALVLAACGDGGEGSDTTAAGGGATTTEGSTGTTAAGTTAAGGGEPIIAATSLPLTGDFSIPAELHRTGYQLCVDLINDRGGVLGAMETQYQRSAIQEQSLLYERMKHSGELPVVGVNTFLPEHAQDLTTRGTLLTRATPEEKRTQLDHLAAFQARNRAETAGALERLRGVARGGGNVFEELMRTVRVASLGQISHALYEVGGRYRRSM